MTAICETQHSDGNELLDVSILPYLTIDIDLHRA